MARLASSFALFSTSRSLGTKLVTLVVLTSSRFTLAAYFFSISTCLLLSFSVLVSLIGSFPLTCSCCIASATRFLATLLATTCSCLLCLGLLTRLLSIGCRRVIPRHDLGGLDLDLKRGTSSCLLACIRVPRLSHLLLLEHCCLLMLPLKVKLLQPNLLLLFL